MQLVDGTQVPARAMFLVPDMDPPGVLVERLGLAMESTPMGLAVTTHDNGRTSVPGVWAAGNCTDPTAHLVTAASAGTLVGMDVNADIIEHELHT